MAHHGLFFLDAGGRLISPESAPCPGEARMLRGACIALRAEAIQNNLRDALLDGRIRHEQQPTALVLHHRSA
jgi:hypothetical protein